MSTVRESLLNWKERLLPQIRPAPRFAGRKQPGVSWLAHNGVRVTMRIARCADRENIQAFVRNLSVRSRYQRFFYPLHELTPALLDRFTQTDPTREITLLVTIADQGKEVVIGMGQYIVTSQERCDFAVAVADAWHDMSIGKSILYALSWVARANGIVWFEGDVLAENAAMRGLLARTGFMVRSHPEDENLVRATKRLARPEGKCSRLAAFLAQVGMPSVHQAGYA